MVYSKIMDYDIDWKSLALNVTSVANEILMINTQ